MRKYTYFFAIFIGFFASSGNAFVLDIEGFGHGALIRHAHGGATLDLDDLDDDMDGAAVFAASTAYVPPDAFPDLVTHIDRGGLFNWFSGEIRPIQGVDWRRPGAFFNQEQIGSHGGMFATPITRAEIRRAIRSWKRMTHDRDRVRHWAIAMADSDGIGHVRHLDQSAVVPVPPAAALFASALVLLGWRRRT